MLAFALLIVLALQWVPAGRSAILSYTTSLWVTPLAIVLLGDTLEEVIGLSSRILVMRDGKVTARLEAPPGAKPQQVELLRHMV